MRFSGNWEGVWCVGELHKVLIFCKLDASWEFRECGRGQEYKVKFRMNHFKYFCNHLIYIHSPNTLNHPLPLYLVIVWMSSVRAMIHLLGGLGVLMGDKCIKYM